MAYWMEHAPRPIIAAHGTAMGGFVFLVSQIHATHPCYHPHSQTSVRELIRVVFLPE